MLHGETGRRRRTYAHYHCQPKTAFVEGNWGIVQTIPLFDPIESVNLFEYRRFVVCTATVMFPTRGAYDVKRVRIIYTEYINIFLSLIHLDCCTRRRRLCSCLRITQEDG